MNELSGGCRVKAWCWCSHLAINMNKIHQLLRLIAVPRHFALFVPEGQLRREREGKKDKKHCYITWTSPTLRQAKKNQGWSRATIEWKAAQLTFVCVIKI